MTENMTEMNKCIWNLRKSNKKHYSLFKCFDEDAWLILKKYKFIVDEDSHIVKFPDISDIDPDNFSFSSETKLVPNKNKNKNNSSEENLVINIRLALENIYNYNNNTNLINYNNNIHFKCHQELNQILLLSSSQDKHKHKKKHKKNMYENLFQGLSSIVVPVKMTNWIHTVKKHHPDK